MVKVVDLRGIPEELLYDETQCNEEIKDGDVLLCDNGVGIMVKAWPVSVSSNMYDFHVLSKGLTWETFKGGKYFDSYKLVLAQNFGGNRNEI